MTVSNFHCPAIMSSMLAIATALASPASAQDAAAAPAAEAQAAQDKAAADAAGDIVVTAQFRSQRLQDTPLAITALNSQALEAKGATTVLDIANSAPNVQMRQAGGVSGGAAQVFIRGVGQADPQFAFEPGVGMYIDDVYYGTVFGSTFDLLDLDRVEVLRGPQGTLSGRNSIGGAVKLFSKKPENDDSGFAQVTYGRFNRLDLRAGVNVSVIADKLMLRASAISRQSDGYFTRYDYGCSNPGSGVATAVGGDCKIGEEGGRNVQGGRLALRARPTEKLEINIAGSVGIENSQLAPQKLLDITAQQNIPAGISSRIFITPAHSRTSYATYINPAFSDPARYNGVPGAGAHPATAFDPAFRLRSRALSGTIDWEIADHVSLKSITAYQYYRGYNAADVDLTPYGLNTLNSRYRYKQFTQELRLSGDLMDRFLEYTLGAYYFKATGRFEGLQLNLPSLATENLYSQSDRIPSESKSLFAHLTANVTEKLSVIGGIRYTDDTKDYYYGRRNPFNPASVAYTAAGAINGVEGHYKGDRVDYRANIQYRWAPQFMTYAQFSTGYRAGGVNPRPYVLEQAVPFQPEKLDAYEVGFKSDLFDRALRVNGSLFINKYNDIIFNNQAPTPNSVLNGTPVNAGDAEFRGVELEANLRPVEGLQIDASGSYLYFKLKRLGAAGANIGGISLNAKAPFAPTWKGNVGMQYQLPIIDHGTITPRVDLSYQSSFFPQIDNDVRAKIAGYALVNSRITWANAKRDVEVSVAIENLFNKFYYLSAIKYPLGVVSGVPAAPRQWSVSLRKSF